MPTDHHLKKSQYYKRPTIKNHENSTNATTTLELQFDTHTATAYTKNRPHCKLHTPSKMHRKKKKDNHIQSPAAPPRPYCPKTVPSVCLSVCVSEASAQGFKFPKKASAGIRTQTKNSVCTKAPA